MNVPYSGTISKARSLLKLFIRLKGKLDMKKLYLIAAFVAALTANSFSVGTANAFFEKPPGDKQCGICMCQVGQSLPGGGWSANQPPKSANPNGPGGQVTDVVKNGGTAACEHGNCTEHPAASPTLSSKDCKGKNGTSDGKGNTYDYCHVDYTQDCNSEGPRI
jgi:hypothetical protein